MSETRSLRFLYNTAIGRGVLKLLIRPGLSKAAGRFLDSSLSIPLIEPFRKSCNISLDGIEIPQGGFPSFNEFFRRKRTEIPIKPTEGTLCSPCDGYLSRYEIDGSNVFSIKHTKFSLPELLKNDEYCDMFAGGTALIFRLTPSDYHRYTFCDSGRLMSHRHIDGVLHCVRPIATEHFPIFVQNTREYIIFKSDTFGEIAQMEVGALLVGRIVNYEGKETFKSGEEKGYFEYGGSTIVVLIKKDAAVFPDELIEATKDGNELKVTQGQLIANKKA